MDKTILLMYISEISGHHSATLAIERAIKELNPHINLLNINGFRYVSPIMERIVNSIYMNAIKRLPHIWAYLYDNPSVENRIAGLKGFINRKKQNKAKGLIESYNCKVVICSQAFPCGIVAEYKKLNSCDIKLIAVVTDFIPHSYWVYDEIDFYIVASQEARNTLLKKGVNQEKIRLFGIPIDHKFSKELDKKTVAKELNIILDKPVILIMGGGRGIGPMRDILYRLDKSDINAHFLIVTGVNKKLFKWLKQRKFNKSVYVYGFIDCIDKLMSISDILVTKPGGITTAEAITKRLPMLIIKPIPGQEQNNTDFLLREDIALKVETAKDAAEKIKMLLGNPQKLSSMGEKMAQMSKPFSSMKIAELALSLC